MPAPVQALTFAFCRRLFGRGLPAKLNTCHPLIFGLPSFRLQDDFWKGNRLFTVVSTLLRAVEGSQMSILISLVSQKLPVKRLLGSEDVGVCTKDVLSQKPCLKSCFLRKSFEPPGFPWHHIHMLDTSLEGIQSSLKAVAKLNVGCSLSNPSLMATGG